MDREQFIKGQQEGRGLRENWARLGYEHEIIRKLRPVYQVPARVLHSLREEVSNDLSLGLAELVIDHPDSTFPEYFSIFFRRGIQPRDLLHKKFREQGFVKEFFKLLYSKNSEGYDRDYSVMVFPVKNYGNWVMHNLPMKKHCGEPRITLPPKVADYADIQIIKLEHFVKEHEDG